MAWITQAALSSTLLFWACAATAEEDLDVHYGCVACHGVDYLRLGPSYQDIAKRYGSTDPAVVDAVARHVIEGSTGAWGDIPMPAFPQLPEQDARQLVKWILSQKPKP